MKRVVRLEAFFFFFMLFVGESRAQSIGEQPYVAFTANLPGFPIASRGGTAPILVSKDDWPGVVRVAEDLREDIQRVSGEAPAMLHGVGDAGKTTPIILGTIGHSPLIDDLIRRISWTSPASKATGNLRVTTIVGEAIPGGESRTRSCRGRQAWHHLRRIRSLGTDWRFAPGIGGQTSGFHTTIP